MRVERHSSYPQEWRPLSLMCCYRVHCFSFRPRTYGVRRAPRHFDIFWIALRFVPLFLKSEDDAMRRESISRVRKRFAQE